MALSIVSSAPGVYIEWMDANAQNLDIGRTDVAGFLGIAERGPFNLAVKIESERQFETVFGASIERGVLAFAVSGFFANGGRRCWVVRLGNAARARTSEILLALPDGAVVMLQATSAGAWGDNIEIDPVWGRDGIVALQASEGDRVQRIALPLPADGMLAPKSLSGIPFDSLPELSPSPLVETTIVIDRASFADASPIGRDSVFLSGGADDVAGAEVRDADLLDMVPGMDALDRVDGISLVAAPDIMLLAADTAAACQAQLALLSRCIARRDRMAILDTPQLMQDQALHYRGLFPDTSFGALYYPWIRVDDPLGAAGALRTIPPSGHVAGMFARTDRLRGVHKPPANEVLEGVWDLSHAVDAVAHGQLNDAHINAIRALPGRGILVLGARTLSTDQRWWFVNVRRLFAMIEEAVDEQMQWLTFEPNSPALWREIDRAVRGLLERLYGAGMLDGASSSDAYSVQCDETTNPPSVVDEGRVVCEIGIQPPYPAEFVIVRIGVTRSGVQVEEKGAHDG
jgi:uncharacterized protein